MYDEWETLRDGLVVPRRLGDPEWVRPVPGRRRHTKFTHPYSYDEFFHFGTREIIGRKGVEADYSDRLYGWDYEKAQALDRKHIGKRWEQAGPDELSRFISAYHGRELRVVALAEGCNHSTGFPYYVVWYVGGVG